MSRDMIIVKSAAITVYIGMKRDECDASAALMQEVVRLQQNGKDKNCNRTHKTAQSCVWHGLRIS